MSPELLLQTCDKTCRHFSFSIPGLIGPANKANAAGCAFHKFYCYIP